MADFDITVNATIADDSITNAKLANAPEGTVKLVPVGSGTSNPIDGDADQASEILDGATDPFARTSALGSYLQDGDTVTSLTFLQGGLRTRATSPSTNVLTTVYDEVATGNRILRIKLNDDNRILTIPADAEISGVNTGDQDLSGLLTQTQADALYDPLTPNRPNNTTPDLSFHYFPVYDPGDAQSEKTDGVEIKAWLAGEFDALGSAAAAQAAAATDATTKANAAQAAAIAASQPLDADLTTIAGLTPSNDDIIQRKAGAWTNRSIAQYVADLASGILGTLLTGLSVATSTAVAATDSILVAFGKLQAFNNLFTTIGVALARLTNPSAVTFIRMNADNTATARTAAEMLGDLAAAPLASPTFTGTPAAPTPAAGTNTTQLATTAFVHDRPMGMHVHSGATWTNMPAAVTFIIGAAGAAVTKLIPLGSFTQVRYVLATGTVAGASGSKLYVRYRSAYSATASDYLLMGATEVECAINSTNTGVDSGWINLVAGAIGDVYVTVLGSGGDGAVDPVFGTGTIYFR
jgi:hypothetical protein